MSKLTAALFVLLAVLFGTIAAAQEENTQQPKVLPLQAQCDPFPKMVETIAKYNEELLFIGEGMTFGVGNIPFKGGMMFFVNQDTGSWSMVQLFNDGMSCMVFMGEGFMPYTGD